MSAQIYTLCKAPAQYIQRIQQPVASCRAGWPSYNGHCYYISPNTMTKYQADAYCSSFGSYLAEFTSLDEFNWMVSYVQPSSQNYFWV